MVVRLYTLEWTGSDLVAEDEDTEYFIVEYLFDEEHMIYNKAEIFYTRLLSDSAYFHTLN